MDLLLLHSFISFVVLCVLMAELTITPTDDLSTGSSSELLIHPPSEIPENMTTTTAMTTNTVDSDHQIDEPPTKKCKIQSQERPRLLEDRLGSILSCCICLDLSILPMFQVESPSVDPSIDHFSPFPVCQWTSDVFLVFQSSSRRL